MSSRRETGAKGAAAEASKSRRGAAGDAGLRENMSQTVTKVESYHWSRAGRIPAGRRQLRASAF